MIARFDAREIRLPLVVIAKLATIIASHAVTSRAFPITHQAIQLT